LILIAFAVVALSATAFFANERVSRFLQVDACLDAGGRWDYQRQQCERPR
jgi:hypothetical protein